MSRGFAASLPGAPFLPDTTGKIFYVDSVTGSNGNSGRSAGRPFATIDFAVGQCTANKGDVILVMPGHNEGLGNAQITVDIAGISIIGLGSGSSRPRIDFDHANASIDVTANGCTLKNLRLLPSVTAVLIAIDVATDVTDTVIDGVETLPGEDGAGVDEFATHIALKGGNTRTLIQNCRLVDQASAAGSINGVLLDDASSFVTIRNCYINLAGAGLVAPINGDTTLSTHLLIENCTLTTDAEPGVEVLTGTTGIIRDTDIFADLGTIAAATVADGMAHFRVRYVEVGNESDAVVKTASVDD